MKKEDALQILETQYQHDSVIREALETLIPEFMKDEDRWIPKELIEYLKQKGDYRSCWIIWLQKQIEHKPNYCHHEVDETGWTEEYRKAFYDGWNNCNMQHAQHKADQKPVKWSDEDENNLKKLLQWDGIPICLRGWVSGLPEKLFTRPSWKPSKEQIEALEKAIVRSCSHQYGVPLSELYEQLMELGVKEGPAYYQHFDPDC